MVEVTRPYDGIFISVRLGVNTQVEDMLKIDV